MKRGFVLRTQESEHSSGTKEGNPAFYAFMKGMAPTGPIIPYILLSKFSKEGKQTSGAGNLCFASCSLIDRGFL